MSIGIASKVVGEELLRSVASVILEDTGSNLEVERRVEIAIDSLYSILDFEFTVFGKFALRV